MSWSRSQFQPIVMCSNFNKVDQIHAVFGSLKAILTNHDLI